MDNTRKIEKIKACIATAIIILVIAIMGSISMKYLVEGDKNLPFKLSKITIISTAEGVENEGTTDKWNMAIYQNNDVYFSIEKTHQNDENSLIESISIENIKIVQKPEKGQIKTYMPNSLEGRLFSYSKEYMLEGNSLIYKGAIKSDAKKLEIGNQGGTAILRFSNVGIGNYISNEDAEIRHDGTMLTKVGITDKDLEFETNFDFVIKLKNKKYVSNITLKMPAGKELIEQGTTSEELKEEYAFRRINE